MKIKKDKNMNPPPVNTVNLLKRSWLLITACTVAVVIAAGCSEESVFTGEYSENQRPLIELTNGPIEGDSVEYHIHFYWIGDDPDGKIDHYEMIMVEGDPIGFDPADTMGADKWATSTSTDTLILARADVYDTIVTINSSPYAVYDKVHTFFIRAVDDRGMASETLHRSFTAWNLAPHIFINEPYNVNPDGSIQTLSPVVRFGWYGKDPIDSPWNYQQVDSVRYMWTGFYSNTLDELNGHPERFEHLWSNWYWINAPGDSGVSTVLGDDEIIPTGRSYVFAVQAMDDAGAISSVFDYRTNARAFMVRTPTGPLLSVHDTYLGNHSFMGVDMDPRQLQVPPGFVMTFTWEASAAHYGAIVSSFRYGWDITDFSDPSDWEVMPNPYTLSAAPKTYYSGVHTLYIEAVDNLGVKTLAVLEITVIPVVMARDLLWVDDFPSSNFTQTLYAFPTESSHDEFWTNICMRAPGFNPTRDIFDVSEHAYQPPPMELIFKYKNIIWSFSGAVDPEQGSTWTRIIRYGSTEFINYIPYFMEFGGHVWTVGPSERAGGLGAVIPLYHRKYPADVRCNILNYWSIECTDTLGATTMPYKDYCVGVIDKIEGVLKTWMPFVRNKELDAMRYAFLDEEDIYTAVCDGFPKKLELWEEVTKPGRFFDPEVRGFHYAEVFDPAYWMRYAGVRKQSCFHPMYRMKAIVDRSVLNDQTVAFWTTKHMDADIPVPGTVAAPSVHFGLPLWFFNRAQVDSIADAIFDVWDIR